MKRLILILLMTLSLSFTWDTDNTALYSYNARNRIDFNTSAFSGILSDHMVALQLTTYMFDYDLALNTNIAFYSLDGDTAFAFDVEEWNPGGTSIVWVELPEFGPSINDSIYLYYNKSGTFVNQETLAYGGHGAVYHFSETEKAWDSTGNNNDEQERTNVTYGVPGILGRGALLKDGVIGTKNPTSGFFNAKGITMSLWVNVNTGKREQVLLDKGLEARIKMGGDDKMQMFYGVGTNVTGVTAPWMMMIPPADTHRFYKSSTLLGVGSWHHVAAIVDINARELRIFVDGEPVSWEFTAPVVYDMAPGLRGFNIGGSDGVVGGEFLDGYVDEVFGFPEVKSIDWVRAHYDMIVNNRKFSVINPIETWGLNFFGLTDFGKETPDQLSYSMVFDVPVASGMTFFYKDASGTEYDITAAVDLSVDGSNVYFKIPYSAFPDDANGFYDLSVRNIWTAPSAYPPSVQLADVNRKDAVILDRTGLVSRNNQWVPDVLLLDGITEKESVFIFQSRKNYTRAVINIMSVRGELVRQISMGEYNWGYYTVRWDGRDDEGSPVPDGVYMGFVEMEEGWDRTAPIVIKNKR